MNAPVLLNLLNELKNTIKCKACRTFLSLFHNKLDSIYHMTLKILKNQIFGVKMSSFTQRYYGHNYISLRNL